MTTWNYIKGSEKDFEGAPDWASMVMEFDGQTIFEEHVTPLIGISRFSIKGDKSVEVWSVDTIPGGTIIALREPVTGINDDRLLASLNDLPLVSEKYPKHDNINHPLRYTKGDIECIDAIKAATVGKTGIEAVDVGHVIRYLWRYEEKDGLESVKKAEWYVKHLINELESNK